MKRSSERWFAMAGVTVMSAVALACFAVAIYAAWLFHDLPDGSEVADFRPVVSARVFAWEGTLIGEYGQERRVYVPYDRMPAHLRHAFLAAEDRDFFQHSGIDIIGVSRAMMKNVANVYQGRRLEGGSTITQQVAKNVLLTNERTLGRKLKEVILARRLESSLSKEQILELYMNDIFLGYRSNGVGSAAFNYFGKSVDQLTLAESAYLAALPKGPANYHPVQRKEQAIARRNWVLGEMARAGFISREEAAAAMKEDLIVQDRPQRAKYHDADYFVAEVESRARGLFPNDPDRIYRDGLYIKTTLDPRLQTYAQFALMNGLEAYDRRHGWRGATAHVEGDGNWHAQAEEMDAPSERRDWRHARVTAAGRGSVSVELVTGEKGTLAASDVSWAFAGKGLKVGDIIFVAPGSGEGVYRLKQIPVVNGALVALDPYTGKVVALVGGYSYSLSKFNRATQARRQPGSSIKPFVYAAALERDFTPASIVDDSPITLPAGGGKAWSPKNYSGDFLGPLPLRRGIELSRNTMTVRLAQSVGIRTVVGKIIDYGVADSMPNEMSIVLGSGEVVPYRLTGAYALFVNGGRRVQPHLIEEVQDRSGTILYKADARVCPSVCTSPFDGLSSPRFPQRGEQVLDPISAYQVNTFLQGAVQRGTATAARSLNRPIGGKTGTTNEYRSAWFVGFSADLVVGVFVGFDDNRSLGNRETGTAAALPIFVDFMGKAYEGKPVRQFHKPKDAVYVNVRGVEEAFKPGTQPRPVVVEPEGPKPYLEVWGANGVNYQVETRPYVPLPADD